jgi:hypothetical protein
VIERLGGCCRGCGCGRKKRVKSRIDTVTEPFFTSLKISVIGICDEKCITEDRYDSRCCRHVGTGVKDALDETVVTAETAGAADMSVQA